MIGQQSRFAARSIIAVKILLNTVQRIDLTNAYLLLRSQSAKQALTGVQDLGFGIISVVDFRTKLNIICFQVSTILITMFTFKMLLKRRVRNMEFRTAYGKMISHLNTMGKMKVIR